MSTPQHTRGEIPGCAGSHWHPSQSPATCLCLYLHCDPVKVPESTIICARAPVADSHRRTLDQPHSQPTREDFEQKHSLPTCDLGIV